MTLVPKTGDISLNDGLRSRVERLELLEAGDVWRLFFEPKEKVRQPPADSGDIERREPDGSFQPGKSVGSTLWTRWTSTGLTTTPSHPACYDAASCASW